jgi:hypothetical protein
VICVFTEASRATYVKDHGGVLLGAGAGSRAHLDGERRVCLGRQGADLLAEHEAGERESGSDLPVHDGGLVYGLLRIGLSEH